jgi:hypothetical protein
VMVEPSVGIIEEFCVNAQPKFTYALPDIVPPCAGVSMVPNGFEAWPLSTVMVLVPRSNVMPAFADSEA